MTRNDVLVLYSTLRTLGDISDANMKFKYAIAKNLRKLQCEVEAIQAATQFKNPRFDEYNKKRLELCKKHAKIDTSSGEPATKNGKFEFVDGAAFNAEVKELQKEYQDAINAFEEQQKNISELIQSKYDDEECKFLDELHKIRLSQIPEAITGSQLEHIMFFVVEDVDFDRDQDNTIKVAKFPDKTLEKEKEKQA